jgi:transposase
MASVRVERLDHWGLMASVIKDFGLMAMIDARLGAEAQEEIPAGEAVAGMLLNGLGCANRPVSFTPQFCAKTPLHLVCREGVRAEMCNRFQLGRTRDQVHTYGGDLLFHDMALAVCADDGRDMRFNHLDTTSFALTGAYGPDSDEQAMTITHGSSQDPRPDLTQAVLARLVSQDGGVPFVSQSWDGHAADPQIFQARAEALITTLQRSSTPRYRVADATLYHEASAARLSPLGCITRIPHTLKRVAQAITPALSWDRWHRLDATTRDHRLE